MSSPHAISAKAYTPRVAGLTIRAREPSDWEAMAALLNLPKVRWGTLRMPFERGEQWRKRLENSPEGMTGIVAELDGRLVGSADVTRFPGRRNHVGAIGMSVHDDFHGRGIGADLLGAVIDVSDNWLNLLRLELKVYVDNEPALRLYRKFGFEVEGTFRADAFRDGRYVDSLAMARLRNDARATP